MRHLWGSAYVGVMVWRPWRWTLGGLLILPGVPVGGVWRSWRKEGRERFGGLLVQGGVGAWPPYTPLRQVCPTLPPLCSPFSPPVMSKLDCPFLQRGRAILRRPRPLRRCCECRIPSSVWTAAPSAAACPPADPHTVVHCELVLCSNPCDNTQSTQRLTRRHSTHKSRVRNGNKGHVQSSTYGVGGWVPK